MSLSHQGIRKYPQKTLADISMSRVCWSMNLFIHFNVPPQFIPKIEEEKLGQYYNINFLLVFLFEEDKFETR